VPEYIDRLNKLKRWYERFRAINDGRVHDSPSDNYQDDVISFFCECHHFKDALKADGSFHISKCNDIAEKHTCAIENFINENQCLSICADICNKAKHVRLNRDPRSGALPEFESKQVHLTLGGHQPVIQATYTITWNEKKINAFELASECVKKWEDFIKISR
jgi:hypothetical protein